MSHLLNVCIHRSNFTLRMSHSLCFGEKGPFEADRVKSHVLFWVSKWALRLTRVKIPSLCVAECLSCAFIAACKKEPKWTQHPIERGVWGGTEKQQGKDTWGWEPKGTDGWKGLKERIVRVEQTGHRKVTAVEKETEGWEKREGPS